MDPDFDPTGFNGTWGMYLPESKVRDPQTGEWVPEPLLDQYLRIQTDGDVMEYRIRVDHEEGMRQYRKYPCRYNDPEWTPYTVYHIDGDPDHPKFQPGENKLLKSGTKLGEPI